MIEALTAAGHDVYCLDWGCPRDEDRYLTWDDILARLARATRGIGLDQLTARPAVRESRRG